MRGKRNSLTDRRRAVCRAGRYPRHLPLRFDIDLDRFGAAKNEDARILQTPRDIRMAKRVVAVNRSPLAFTIVLRVI